MVGILKKISVIVLIAGVEKVMKLGITGTRKGISQPQTLYFIRFMSENNISELHHGGCRGVDLQLEDTANKLFQNVYIVTHLPKKKDSEQYIKRNHEIVDICDYLLAFPYASEVLRSGTWATIRYAKKVGKEGKIIYANGLTENFMELKK